MKPLRLELTNARTFDSLAWDIPQGVATAICASNGAGKSTICNAIDAALFGAEGRSLADWLSRDRPEQTMVISVTFEHGGRTYVIRRIYDRRGRGTSRVTFELYEGDIFYPLTRESAAATQEEIERIIGLDRASFRASAFMAQGDGGAFCEATPGRRKEILASVLGLGVWDGYRDRARADLRAAEQSLAVVRAKIEAAEEELNTEAAVQSERDGAQARERDARAALEECSLQLAKARERLSALREAAGLREATERARDAAERAHASLLERIAALERQISEAEGRLAEREGLEVLVEGLPGLEAEQRVLAGEAEDYAERQQLLKERARLFDETADLVARGDGLAAKALAAAENTATEICELCERPLDDASARAVVASYRAQADELGKRALQVAREADALTPKIEARPEEPPDSERAAKVADLIRLGQDAQVKLAALAEVAKTAHSLRYEVVKLKEDEPVAKARADAARDEVTALGPTDNREGTNASLAVARLETEELEQRAKLDRTLQEIARLDERLVRLDKLAADTTEARSQGLSLGQEVELLSYLERACGPNGVPALILETSAIPQMEAEWNRVLRLLPTESGDIFEVELHTQRERKTGDGAVDALDIVVYSGGVARPYSTYSGGERARIDIAQRRALSALLAHRKGAECPLMILDEPNSLDDQGMAALAQVLEDLAASEDLTILVISHDPALRDAFENSIEIFKADGRSRIVGATEPAPIMEAS